MIHEEKVNELNSIRLSKEKVTSTMIYNFFENENEEKIIRGVTFSAEVIFCGKKWSGKVGFSSKYRKITWGTEHSSTILDYNGKKFSPKTRVTEELIIINNAVEFKISNKLEYNIFLILLMDADNRLSEGRVFKPVEIPDRLEIDRGYFVNSSISEKLHLSDIVAVKYNSMLDCEWVYHGDIDFFVGKDFIASVLVNGKIKDIIDGHIDLLSDKHVAGHHFRKGLNILFGEEFINYTIFIYTDGIHSPVYSFRLKSMKEIQILGAWLLENTRNILERNIDIYLTSEDTNGKSNQKTEKSRSNDNDLRMYVEKFQELFVKNPYGFTEKRIFEACLSDIFPNEKNICFALSALFSDGIMGRLHVNENDETFIMRNSEILTSYYGIQDKLAFIAASIWNSVRRV